MIDAASLSAVSSGKAAERKSVNAAVADESPVASSSSSASNTTAAPQSNVGDLKDSARRLDTIDAVSGFADELFNAQHASRDELTTNQQGLSQQDYRLSDGTGITAWGTEDGATGAAHVRAQEAQMPNGEVVDRWFHDNGSVEQVMHQYDADHSISVYYYDNGQPEAIRIVQNGREIFMRYDRDGRLLEKTVN